MRKGLNANQIKLIAYITMFVDHLSASIVAYLALKNAGSLHFSFTSGEAWSTFYTVLRTIGRMAFPIYCFFIVEGFSHTRDRKKYALRLLALAIVSEVPFDYALNDMSFFDPKSNNVSWSLLLGLLCIWIISEIQSKLASDKIEDKAREWILVTIITVAFMALAYFCRVDYKAAGIAAIVLMYLLRKDRMVAFAAGVLALTFLSSDSEVFAMLMLIPIYFYNGQKGSKSKAITCFSYAFYPVHLALLGIILIIISG